MLIKAVPLSQLPLLPDIIYIVCYESLQPEEQSDHRADHNHDGVVGMGFDKVLEGHHLAVQVLCKALVAIALSCK